MVTMSGQSNAVVKQCYSSRIHELLRKVKDLRYTLLRRSHEHAMSQIKDMAFLTCLGKNILHCALDGIW